MGFSQIARYVNLNEFGLTENLRITMNIIRPDYTSMGQNVGEIDDNDDHDESLPELSKDDLKAAELIYLISGDNMDDNTEYDSDSSREGERLNGGSKK